MISLQRISLVGTRPSHEPYHQYHFGLCFLYFWWRLLKTLVTPHPLGGCSMADTAATGVVDHRGQVFGYPNLFVADGSVIPRAIGLNPSKTIAAVAERTAALMIA